MNATASSSAVRLVAIDDDPQSLRLIKSVLDQKGLEIFLASDADRGMELIHQERPQIVLLDLRMPKASGIQLLEQVTQIDPGIDVMLITGDYSAESAVEAIQKGACDYLTKPFVPEKLRQRIDQLLADARIRQRSLQLEHELLEAYQFQGIVGRSPLMLDVFHKIRRVAPHFRSVLVTGETGTGKELLARALHQLSPAVAGPFVACNCSAVAETLFESELFGHVKGAFTGASQDKLGFFEYAHGGTLLLDEIGDMSLAMQAKLLRVLETHEIQRVGSPAVRKVDVRVIAATNRDLRAMVAERTFREDLYYRLSAMEIQLPALTERKEDLLLLQRHFVEHFAEQYKKRICGLTRRAQNLLARYHWPGNVRELQNVIGHACMMTEGEAIDVRDLPPHLRDQKAQDQLEEKDLLPLEEVQRRYARRVLERVGGNKSQAAKVLGISRSTLYQLLGVDNQEEVQADLVN
jgi:DNA-binding NtrC family response regulator